MLVGEYRFEVVRFLHLLLSFQFSSRSSTLESQFMSFLAIHKSVTPYNYFRISISLPVELEMKLRNFRKPQPCKKRRPSIHIGVSIYLFRKVASSFCVSLISQQLLFFMQNPKHTLFVFVALLLFALPLLLTLRKFVDEEASAERSHQLTALKFRMQPMSFI